MLTLQNTPPPVCLRTDRCRTRESHQCSESLLSSFLMQTQTFTALLFHFDFMCICKGAKSFREVLHELMCIVPHLLSFPRGERRMRKRFERVFKCGRDETAPFWKFPLYSYTQLRVWYFEAMEDGWLPTWPRCFCSFCRLPLQVASLPGRLAKGPIVHSTEAMAS